MEIRTEWRIKTIIKYLNVFQLPLISFMATTRVNVDPSDTIPLTGGAQGPFPC